MLKKVLHQIKLAFKANLKPGFILWIFMLVFFVAYATNTAFVVALGKVSAFKISVGYPFSFGVYVLFAALMPEILKIVFFQKRQIKRENLYNLIFVGLVFGFLGVLTDIFYGYQVTWFGEDNDLRTLSLKAFVDQAIYGPAANYFLVSVFFLRESKIKLEALKNIFTTKFAFDNVLPVVIAAWCVWMPGVILVYSMPTDLQLPVCSLILCFWVLIFTFVAKTSPEKTIEETSEPCNESY